MLPAIWSNPAGADAVFTRQFYDLIEIFRIGGYCPHTNYLFLGASGAGCAASQTLMRSLQATTLIAVCSALRPSRS
jgi:hypothetical protein